MALRRNLKPVAVMMFYLSFNIYFTQWRLCQTVKLYTISKYWKHNGDTLPKKNVFGECSPHTRYIMLCAQSIAAWWKKIFLISLYIFWVCCHIQKNCHFTAVLHRVFDAFPYSWAWFSFSVIENVYMPLHIPKYRACVGTVWSNIVPQWFPLLHSIYTGPVVKSESQHWLSWQDFYAFLQSVKHVP
jgi:hypothetical protein